MTKTVLRVVYGNMTPRRVFVLKNGVLGKETQTSGLTVAIIAAKGFKFMKRVYTPNKRQKSISSILTELYLFKHALHTEDLADLERRVDKVRSMMLELHETLESLNTEDN